MSTHGRSHLDVLLPSLEEGLFDDNWRIRQSSVQLLGDLLYLVGGTKASDQSFMAGADDDDDENEGVEIYEGNATLNAARAMAAVLGMERRNAILATLYLLRSDTSSGVRQCALQVWKTMVPNTPRTVREILPVVVAQVVEALASGNLDKRTVAGRALGDVVKKLGESVLIGEDTIGGCTLWMHRPSLNPEGCSDGLQCQVVGNARVNASEACTVSAAIPADTIADAYKPCPQLLTRLV